MEGTRILKSVYYTTESTRECQKAKKIGAKISISGAFVALSKLFFTILSCKLSFALSQIPSRPVAVFRTESRFVPSRQKPVSTQHYHLCMNMMQFFTGISRNTQWKSYILSLNEWMGIPKWCIVRYSLTRPIGRCHLHNFQQLFEFHLWDILIICALTPTYLLRIHRYTEKVQV